MLFRRSKNSRNYDVFLALSFADYVKKDFTENQLSGNTAKNIRAIKTNYYTSMVFISPPVYYQYEYIKNKYMLAIIDTIIKKMSRERCGYGVK